MTNEFDERLFDDLSEFRVGRHNVGKCEHRKKNADEENLHDLYHCGESESVNSNENRIEDSAYQYFVAGSRAGLDTRCWPATVERWRVRKIFSVYTGWRA